MHVLFVRDGSVLYVVASCVYEPVVPVLVVCAHCRCVVCAIFVYGMVVFLLVL